MNTPRRPRFDEPRSRRSHKVALVLLGTAGVVGGVAIWDAWRREREEAGAPTAASAPEALSTERTYPNNHHVPGAGYYHAPFFGWFPFPWNHHDPARGYFAGGQWRPAPHASEVQQSRPATGAVAAATAAQRAGMSQFSSRSGAPAAKPSVLRGGFGSSSRGGGLS